MRERSAAEHDPAQAGEQYVSLAMTVACKISYKDWVGVPWLRKIRSAYNSLAADDNRTGGWRGR